MTHCIYIYLSEFMTYDYDGIYMETHSRMRPWKWNIINQPPINWYRQWKYILATSQIKLNQEQYKWTATRKLPTMSNETSNTLYIPMIKISITDWTELEFISESRAVFIYTSLIVQVYIFFCYLNQNYMYL